MVFHKKLTKYKVVAAGVRFSFSFSFRLVAVSLPCRCRVWLVTLSFFFLSFFEIDGLPSRNRVLIKYGYPTVQLLTG